MTLATHSPAVPVVFLLALWGRTIAEREHSVWSLVLGTILGFLAGSIGCGRKGHRTVAPYAEGSHVSTALVSEDMTP
ncbi:MAG: hypothetical protein KAU10_09890, partial [Dehalococcoidia bacterium]|nr:hypothetical protein [Dehalococcoidia bacterium]